MVTGSRSRNDYEHAEAALVEAILTTRHNHGLRLLYADWLDVHGDPDRAAFLRLQCHHNQHDNAVVARTRELLRLHQAEWLGPLAQLRTPPNFSLGFPDLTYLPDMNEQEWHVVAGSPYLRLVNALTFARGSRVTAAGAHVLSTSPYLSGIHSLTMTRVRIEPEGLQALLKSPGLARLESLSLDGEDSEGSELTFGDLNLIVPCFDLRHVQAVANSPNASHLAMLSLRYNRLDDRAAEALVNSAHLTRLKCLHLYLNAMSPGAIAALRARFGVCVTSRHG